MPTRRFRLRWSPRLDGLRESLIDDHARETGLLAGNGLVRESARLALSDARQRIEGWRVSDSARSIRGGLTRTYRRGRRQLKLAVPFLSGAPAPLVAATDTDVGHHPGAAPGHTAAEVFHTWRKRAKYLRYQLELLGPAWPAVLDATSDELHRLTDLLGDGNDATQLAAAPALAQRGMESVASFMTSLCTAHRDGLWRRAVDLGTRLYAEPPKPFVDRVGVYYDAWRDPSSHGAPARA